MSTRAPQLLALAASLPIVIAGTAQAAPVAATADAAGHATLVGSLGVLKRADLDFGELAVAGVGTAVIDPASGSLTTTGGVTRIDTSAHAATFTGTGSRNSVVLIRLPKNPIMLTRVGGTETMTVSNWTLDGKANRKIPPSQAFDFSVGGTLNVAAGQADGTYVGSFTVTIQYP
jgi:hypothetical protein